MDTLFRLLRCPECGDELSFDGSTRDEGVLRSSCGAWHPVVSGIPRVFVGEMRRVLATDFGDFLRRHGLRIEEAPLSSETRDKLATRESFGYEWTHFHEMLPEWSENARFYFEPIGALSGVRGRLCFEGGCGKGRHTYQALDAGGRVVAVDFSRAVDVAARNCADVDGERLFVQADLMSLPFAAGTFDLTYSFGVLHHLPDPEGGFERLVKLVRPGGQVLVYLYHAREGEPFKRAVLSGINLARRVTTHLPHGMLLPLTTALGYVLYGAVVIPYRIMSSFAITRPLAERLPLTSYARYPVRVIVNDQFDRFSAPIENRYRRHEIEAWLSRAGLVDPRILGGAGWRAAGIKPA